MVRESDKAKLEFDLYDRLSVPLFSKTGFNATKPIL